MRNGGRRRQALIKRVEGLGNALSEDQQKLLQSILSDPFCSACRRRDWDKDTGRIFLGLLIRLLNILTFSMKEKREAAEHDRVRHFDHEVKRRVAEENYRSCYICGISTGEL